jgi:outer membrane protein assembly factor BamA
MILLLLTTTGMGYGLEVPPGEGVPLETDTLPARTFRFLPILSYAQETSLQLGGYGLYAFSLEENDSLTRSSHVSLTALYTLNKQAILKAQGDIWSKNNTWHWAAEAGFRNFPFSFYGIGAQTRAKDQELLVEKRVNFYLSAERQIVGPYYVGLQLGVDAYRYRSIEPAGRYQSDSTITGKRGGQLVSLGLLQVYDSRNSVVYPTRGLFARFTAGYAPKLANQQNYRGSFLLADLRLVKSLSPAWVLGLQGVYQAYLAERVPFYLLPQLGSDQLMRGYYTGRYRDKQLGAAQAEIRFRFTPQLGVVGFLGVGTVTSQVGLLMHTWKHSYGVGLRYFVDTRQGLSIRLDYGIGQRLPDEKRQSGFYFSLGEAF